MSDEETLLDLLQTLQREIRDQVVAACSRESVAELSLVADDSPGDTIYRIDKVSEAVLVDRLGAAAAALGGVLLVAEGVAGGELVLPQGYAGTPAWRVIVDPIDGTRGIMYQK